MMMQQFGWLTGCHSLPKSCENNSKQREPKSWPNVFVLAGRKAEKARTPLVFFNFFITSHRFSILTSSPWPSTAAVRDERGGKSSNDNSKVQEKAGDDEGLGGGCSSATFAAACSRGQLLPARHKKTLFAASQNRISRSLVVI